MVRAAAVVLLALLLLMGANGTVFAHAALLASTPADGAVLATAPERLTLTFTEAVKPLVLRLIGPDAGPRTLDRVGPRGTLLEIEVPAGLGQGAYVLSWRVISADGHPVAGSILFRIGAAGAAAPGMDAEAVDWPVRAALWCARVLLYLAFFIGIGGAFFTAWIAPAGAPPQPLPAAAMLAGLAAAVASVGLQGLDALGQPLASLRLLGVWQAGFATSHGLAVGIALPALALGLLSLSFANGTAARLLSLGALLGVGGSLAASGHAAAALPQALTRPALFLHGLGVAFWIGALAPMAGLLRSDTAAAQVALRLFSRLIPAVLALLLAAGLILAAVQLDRPDDLWTTGYGRVLAAKLMLLLLLLGLAALNRTWLALDTIATAPLRRSILAEIALGIGILAVVALWRFTPPPRALVQAAEQAQAVTMHIHGGKAMADLRLTPGRAGRIEASIDLMTGAVGVLEAKEVTLVLALPSAGIEPIARPARNKGEGAWQVDDLILPLPGRWSVRIDILVSDFEMLTLRDTIEIGP